MSAMKPAGKPGQEEDVSQIHRIRITLTSRNVKNLEKGEGPLQKCGWALCGNMVQVYSLQQQLPSETTQGSLLPLLLPVLAAKDSRTADGV